MKKSATDVQLYYIPMTQNTFVHSDIYGLDDELAAGQYKGNKNYLHSLSFNYYLLLINFIPIDIIKLFN